MMGIIAGARGVITLYTHHIAMDLRYLHSLNVAMHPSAGVDIKGLRFGGDPQLSGTRNSQDMRVRVKSTEI